MGAYASVTAMTTSRRKLPDPTITFAECEGHYDDDRALEHGEYECDGYCQQGRHADDCGCPDCENERALQDDYDARH